MCFLFIICIRKEIKYTTPITKRYGIGFILISNKNNPHILNPNSTNPISFGINNCNIPDINNNKLTIIKNMFNAI